MEEKYRQYSEFDLAELFTLLREKFAVIFAAALGCGLLAMGFTFCFVTPQYEADVNMIVNTKQSDTAMMTNDNITSAKNLVDTYAIIIKSNIVLEQVIERLEMDMNYDAIYEKIDVSPIDDTQIMKITARDADPERAMRIVQTISEIAPPVIAEAVEFGSCKAVSKVKVDSAPVSPNIPKVTLIAAFLGMVLSIAVVLLKELLNDTVLDEDDVYNKLDLPTLGMIPSLETE